MEGYEYINKRRNEKGYSVRELAKLVGLSPRTISDYCSGAKNIGSMAVYKSIILMDLLDIPIEQFFDDYYSYKVFVDEKKEQLNIDNPIDYRFPVIKKRLYLRLEQIKKRGNIPDNELEEIYKLYESFISNYARQYRRCDVVSVEEYESLVMPIYYRIRTAMDKLPDNRIGQIIVDGIHKTNYRLKDVCYICNITNHHMGKLLNGINENYDFMHMRTDSALKVCYALNLDFCFVFKQN